MIVKTDLDPRVVWKLELVAEKQGQTLGEYLAVLASREVERPVVRVDWWEGIANRCIRLMDAGRSNDEIAELLGVSTRTVKKYRAMYVRVTKVEASA